MADYELTQIEDFFNEQRAQARWPFKRLDSTDWAYMDAWQKDGIPFAVICRGIAEVFEQQRRKSPKDKINTVRYCEGAIKRHWKDHVAAHVGGSDVVTGHQAEFGEAHIREALQCWIDRLQKIASEHSHGSETIPFATNVAEVAGGLQSLRESLTASLDLESLDSNLQTLENLLTTALLGFIGQSEFDTLAAKAEKELARLKANMMPNLWQETVQNNVLKQLREQYRIPRLSLFYL